MSLGRCRCGRTWDSTVQCHCPSCHRQFAGVTAFDDHRVSFGYRTGLRTCRDPATMRRKDGTLILVASEETFGTVWRRAGSRPKWLFTRPHLLTEARTEPGL